MIENGVQRYIKIGGKGDEGPRDQGDKGTRGQADGWTGGKADKRTRGQADDQIAGIGRNYRLPSLLARGRGWVEF